MDNSEQQWAVALKNAQNQTRKQNTVPLALQKKQAKEEFAYYKRRLVQACESKSQTDVEKYTELLLKTRAQLVDLKLKILMEKNHVFTEAEFKNEISKYTSDCVRIIKIAEALMK